MYKVLFVCTGNICRSSTAEGVMKKYIKESGLEDKIKADSAGMISFHTGENPDPRAIKTALAKGYDISQQRARQVSTEDFKEFDMILAMAHTHEHQLYGLRPNSKDYQKAELLRFMSFAPEFGVEDVADPYYGTQNDFDIALEMIETGCRELVKHIKNEKL